MTINEYQKEALRTAPTWWPNPFEPLKNGPAIDILKKQLFQGRPLDREHLAKELGDAARYLAVSAAALGYTLEEILEMNVKFVNNRPAVDAEPVRHSKWVCRTHGVFSCGACLVLALDNRPTRYCHECGAKMDGGD